MGFNLGFKGLKLSNTQCVRRIALFWVITQWVVVVVVVVVIVVVAVVVVVVVVVVALVNYSLRNNPQQRSLQLPRCGILKSRNVYGDTFVPFANIPT